MYSFIYVQPLETPRESRFGNPEERIVYAQSYISRQNQYLRDWKTSRYNDDPITLVPIIANKNVGKTIYINEIKDLHKIEKDIYEGR